MYTALISLTPQSLSVVYRLLGSTILYSAFRHLVKVFKVSYAY